MWRIVNQSTNDSNHPGMSMTSLSWRAITFLHVDRILASRVRVNLEQEIGKVRIMGVLEKLSLFVSTYVPSLWIPQSICVIYFILITKYQ